MKGYPGTGPRSAGPPEGNTNSAGHSNRSNGKRFQSALKRALEEYSDDRVARGDALNTIAMDLVREALLGQQWAILEIANRLDGKPAQTTLLGNEDESQPLRLGIIDLVRPQQLPVS